MALKSRQLNLLQEDPAARPVPPAALSESLRACSGQLPENVYWGTSSWAFPGWKGIVYDSQSPDWRLAREGLWAYSRHPLLRARCRCAPFNRIVDEDPESRGAIASLCRRAASQGRPILVIANHKAQGSAPLPLFKLAELLGAGAREQI